MTDQVNSPLQVANEPGPTPPANPPQKASIEAFLSGAYRRILRMTMVLTAAGVLGGTFLFGWHSGTGVAVGSFLAGLNFVWLHHGVEMMVQRMMADGESGPSKLRLVLAFVGRYGFMIAIAYVILKGYPRILGGFIVGLAFPILAAMAEGFYEAVVSNSSDQTPD